MAQTPAERRERRNAYAQSLTDPRTGKPFKTYNALDTWQRNQTAQAKGFSSRATQRVAETVDFVKEKFPGSWPRFLGERKPSESLAREFLKAWGPITPAQREAQKEAAHRLRADFLNSNESGEWNWSLWRDEYSAI